MPLCGDLHCKCSTRMLIYLVGGDAMNKTISMSIRVSEDELGKLKEAAKIEAYASYSEFIRRTALKEAERVIEDKQRKIKNEDI